MVYSAHFTVISKPNRIDVKFFFM